MRMTFSRSKTKILPSPIFPVLADFSIASITCSSISDLIAASIFTLGRKSTTYSAPRKSSVCPFWRPKPFTSLTVIPCTPTAARRSFTSSSLKGLMIASIRFMPSREEQKPGQRRIARPRYNLRGVRARAQTPCRRLLNKKQAGLGGGRQHAPAAELFARGEKAAGQVAVAVCEVQLGLEEHPPAAAIRQPPGARAV